MESVKGITLTAVDASVVVKIVVKLKRSKMDKRYWLFAWESKNQRGGMNDFIYSFPSVSNAMIWFNELREQNQVDTYHVFDSVIKEVVKKGDWSDFQN